MAAGARGGRGLVVRAIAMTRHAHRAIVPGWSVRRMAGRARAVLRHRVELRQRRAGMTARARRRCRGPDRCVRAMAGRAAELRAVVARALGNVAGAARGCGGRGRMRAMARLAGAMPSGCAGRLVRMAARTRGTRGTRRVCGIHMASRTIDMTGRSGRPGLGRVARGAGGDSRGGASAVRRMTCIACRVTGPCRGASPIGMTARARRRLAARLAVVGEVTIETRHRAVVSSRMTARARGCHRRGRARRGSRVRRMTAGACHARCRRWMSDASSVAARARTWSVVVRRMTRGAAAMGGRRDHGSISVTGRARSDLARAERVRAMAAGARGMSCGDRAIVDVATTGLLRMAALAAAIRGHHRLVHRMTVETPACPGVARRLRRVTARARHRIEGW